MNMNLFDEKDGLPNVGIAISLGRCPGCRSGFALVQTRRQAKAMVKAGVLGFLKRDLPDLVAIWGGSGLKACPECGRLLPLPTPKEWGDSSHSQLDFGLGTGAKTVVDSGIGTPCSACGASCIGEPGTWGRIRTISLSCDIATGQTGAVIIQRTPVSQPIVYADIHPDYIDLDFPICGPKCADAMRAELDKADIDFLLGVVLEALEDRGSWVHRPSIPLGQTPGGIDTMEVNK